MAELFLAQESTTRHKLVIKRILPYLSHDEEFVQMFLDEARIAAQLDHPNIIQVYELGKIGEAIFLALEYVHGSDLRRLFEAEIAAGRAVPPDIAAYVVAQVCAGLHYAHFRTGRDGRPLGIVHRDVSPQNVMVGLDGAVKLVDFGIAKASAWVERSKPGVIKGKYLYLAPEQLTGERIDHRADLFAIGTLLYEVTTGVSPFQKPTTEAVLYAIRAEDPLPPHEVRRGYPIALSRIVMKCLTKDRERRYQSGEEIQVDLEEFLRSQGPVGPDEVGDYVARKLRGDDEQTTQSGAPVSAGSPRVGRRPTPSEVPSIPLLPDEYVHDAEPQTQTLEPDEIERLLRDPGAAADRRPSRELSSEGTGETRVEVRSLRDPSLAGMPALGPEPTTLPESRSLPRSQDLTRRDRGISLPADEERSTQTTRPAGQGPSSFMIGAIAFVSVFLVGILVLFFIVRLGSERPAPVAPPTPAKGDPRAPPAGEMRVPPSAARVRFDAPKGTRILHEGKLLTPGVEYSLRPGTIRVTFRCPIKRKGLSKELTQEVVLGAGDSVQVVTLCR